MDFTMLKIQQGSLSAGTVKNSFKKANPKVC